MSVRDDWQTTVGVIDGLRTRIAELEAHAEHDEDNLGGLQHALVRANQQYTQAETALAERDRMLDDCYDFINPLRYGEGELETRIRAANLANAIRARAEEGSEK